MKESDIRPAKKFKEYLRLSEKDIQHYFCDCDRFPVICPGCRSEDSNIAFEKHGFSYQQCNSCDSLYLSPRPSIESFERFYNNSESSQYWAETFFPSVAEVRRKKIFKPRAEQLYKMCSKNGIRPQTLMDIGAGYGIFLEEWEKISPQTKVIAVEPSASFATVCRSKGFEVIETIAEKIVGYEEKIDLLTCFEVLEHVYDPFAFVKTLASLIHPGGAMLISTLCVDGFDIQLLWERSLSVSPPHHINFLSIKGLEFLFKMVGMDHIEIITPGVLDVEIVKNAYKEDVSILNGNKFIEKIILNDTVSGEFQNFLSANRLSSHAWVFAKKRI